MLPVLSSQTIRELDKRSEALGIPPLLLMESAGRGAAEEVRKWLSDVRGRKILALCGKGGNGGDALCALRYLGLWGAAVRAIVLGQPSGATATQLQAFSATFPEQVQIVENEQELNALRDWLAWAEIVLDGILGVGGQGPAQGLPQAAIELLTNFSGLVVAIDLPSGVSPDSGKVLGPAVRAHLTLAMASLKPCHLLPPAAELCGEVRVVEVAYPPAVWQGISPLAEILTDEYCASLLPGRPKFGHKGTFGRVLVVAGSVGMAGAAALCAEGALRAGAGLVHVLTPEPVFPIVAGLLPEALVHPGPADQDGTFAPEAAEEALTLAAGMDVVVIGPGIGRAPGPAEVVRALFTEKIPRLVLDADALFALAQDKKLLRRRHGELVLTPHPGEFARFVDAPPEEVVSEKIQWVREKAREWKAVVVLKGPPTAIADPAGKVFLNTTGNTALAHGGSGDVLAGLIAGLWAGGIAP
ncbi:MAG: NAD(P)H-hydrate dehydratase, partial [Candidatus Bipolaricaulota bacterium]|nr:NAD(P)H-hydrate dehydratase [Candidatus Bipolaricaulota bacterium]MDW8126868.1 NAD(P)H-hydrate dehydratase [Candidatus Bipolaricaulota bacterium]